VYFFEVAVDWIVSVVRPVKPVGPGVAMAVRRLPVRERERLEGILVLALFLRPGIQAEGWMAKGSSVRQYRK